MKDGMLSLNEKWILIKYEKEYFNLNLHQNIFIPREVSNKIV